MSHSPFRHVGIRCDPLRPAAGRSGVLAILPIGGEGDDAAMSVMCMKTPKKGATHIVDTLSI